MDIWNGSLFTASFIIMIILAIVLAGLISSRAKTNIEGG